jgi:hypothetical protein
MSGVILEDGSQYESCCVCGHHVLFVGRPAQPGEPTLCYEQPSERFPHGRDICSTCIALPRERQDEIVEARKHAWLAKQVHKATSGGWQVRIVDDRIKITGPLTHGQRVVIRDGNRPGYITSIGWQSDNKVAVKPDDNPLPIGTSGCVEFFDRDELVAA